MSGLINIAGLTPVEDPSYRYKMPQVRGKIEGRGNGIKTLLINVKDVSLALNREAPEITKFFGTELGAQTTYDEEVSGIRAIVNGAHSDVLLHEKLKTYIEKFVLCRNCHLPETHYKIKEGIITQKCLACGSKTPCEMTHKLTTFILNQQKKAKSDAKKAAAAEGGDKKDKKEKKKDKSEAAAAAGGGAEGAAEGADGGSPRESKKKKDKDKGESGENGEKKKKSKDKKTFFDAEDPDAAGAGEDDNIDDAKTAEEAIVRFRSWMTDNATTAAPEKVLEELRMIQIQHSMRPADRFVIFLGAVFTDNGAATAKQITTHKPLLALMAPSAIQQRHLIAGVEWFCGVKHPSLTRFFPLFLKGLFDEEVVEEDIFFNWSTDYARNEFSTSETMIDIDTLEAMKASAAPFITWLQEAEEEGDDEDEEEEEEDD